MRIPYSILPPKALKKFSRIFMALAQKISFIFPFLKFNLKQANIRITVQEYLSMCICATLLFFLLFCAALIFLLANMGLERVFSISVFIALAVSIFVFAQQMAYPKLTSRKRIRSLERNLLPALQNISIQLNSGVPVFNALANVSAGDYGAVSTEFKKAIKEINAGKPQAEALEEIASVNPSVMFRRTIWQIVNGMKAGSNLVSVIDEATKGISEEQVIQIQKYGSQLSPLAMFYMLIAIIIPALSVTFVIIISSFIALSEGGIRLVFGSIFGIIIFFQIMFMGLIKSRRPNLL